MRKIGMLVACGLFLAFGIGDLERGNRLYREGRYAEAVEAYRAVLREGDATPALHYNLGTALLRIGRYDEAERHLRAALSTVEPEMRERTHYNLGNRFLQAGRSATDPEARAKLLDAAVEAYRQTLRLNPADVDAKWNLELALRERENPPPTPQGGGGDPQQDQQDQQNSGGGGGADQQRPSRSSSSGGQMPDRSRGQGGMTREQAERILSAVEQDERELYREMLRKGQRDTPVARDW